MDILFDLSIIRDADIFGELVFESEHIKAHGESLELFCARLLLCVHNASLSSKSSFTVNSGWRYHFLRLLLLLRKEHISNCSIQIKVHYIYDSHVHSAHLCVLVSFLCNNTIQRLKHLDWIVHFRCALLNSIIV